MDPLFYRALDAITNRRPSTDSHRAQARETSVSLGLMADAANAAEPTDEQRLFLASSASGMRAREAYLLTMPNRSREQEIELQMIRRDMARIEGRPTPVPRATAPRRGFLAAPALMGGLRPWMLWAGAMALLASWGMLQTGRLASVKADLHEREIELSTAERNLMAARETTARMAEAVRNADEQTRETAELMERERRIRQRAQAESRRIQRERDQAFSGEPVDYGFGSVRDPGPSEAEPGSGAGTGDRPGAVSR